MHAPSALVAGAVVTFGIAALANLYLPATNPLAGPVPAHQAAQQEPELPYPVAESFNSPAVPSEEEIVATPPEAPSPEASAYAAPVVAEQTHGPVPRPELEPVKIAPQPRKQEPARPRAAKERETVSERMVTAREQKPKEEEHPTQFTPKSSPAVFAQAGNTPLQHDRSSGSTGLSVSAIAGDRAWVRIRDRRTVAVRAGDIVPGTGRVKSVSTNSVVFENGLILRVTQ